MRQVTLNQNHGPYWVKKCSGCQAVNHPALTACQKCGTALPSEKTASDTPAPTARATAPEPPSPARPGTQNCPACHGLVSIALRSCPHCGHKLNPPGADPLDLRQPVKPGAALGYLALAGLAVYLIFFNGHYETSAETRQVIQTERMERKSAARHQEDRPRVLTAPEPKPPVAERDLAIDAYVECQSHVPERLKSPATAKFPFYSSKPLKRDDGAYVVSSYVDSQNGFGALLRTHYVCVIAPLEDPAGRLIWRLEDLTFLNP